jgi:hypothetical protein
MVFRYEGIDPNGVPIYVDVPVGDQDIEKPGEPVVKKQNTKLQDIRVQDTTPPANPKINFIKPAEDAPQCTVPCAYLVVGIIGTFLLTYWLTSN